MLYGIARKLPHRPERSDILPVPILELGPKPPPHVDPTAKPKRSLDGLSDRSSFIALDSYRHVATSFAEQNRSAATCDTVATLAPVDDSHRAGRDVQARGPLPAAHTLTRRET